MKKKYHNLLNSSFIEKRKNFTHSFFKWDKWVFQVRNGHIHKQSKFHLSSTRHHEDLILNQTDLKLRVLNSMSPLFYCTDLFLILRNTSERVIKNERIIAYKAMKPLFIAVHKVKRRAAKVLLKTVWRYKCGSLRKHTIANASEWVKL